MIRHVDLDHTLKVVFLLRAAQILNENSFVIFRNLFTLIYGLNGEMQDTIDVQICNVHLNSCLAPIFCNWF